MKSNKAYHRTISVLTGESVEIKFWAEPLEKRIYVAAFDASGNQVSRTTYSAETDIADDLYARTRESLIENLASILESDLKTNPELHYRSAKD